MTGLRKPWQRQGRSFIRKLNECLGAFPVIKVKVIKVIKDFWLFKMSDPKYGLQLMSDDYILENLIEELRETQ